MIADEPDEDADALDDEALFAAYLDQSDVKLDADSANALPDWPPLREREVGLSVDGSTLSWFKANHPDWRHEMGLVLRAWVMAQTRLPGSADTDELVSTLDGY